MSSWADWERCPPGEALRAADPEIAELIEEEIARQNDGIELIASENFVSPGVLEAMGSPLTNKYAEGLPGKRYYGGCEVVDKIEQLAIDRAKQLFGADHANVLVLPARFVGTEEGKAILKAWLDTPFAGGRHARRIAKIERDAEPNTSTEESR